MRYLKGRRRLSIRFLQVNKANLCSLEASYSAQISVLRVTFSSMETKKNKSGPNLKNM